MFRPAVLGAVAALVLTGGAARAENFDFSYTVSGTQVMGTFVTTMEGTGTYLITSIVNGTRGANAITLLAPNDDYGNDNILKFPGTPFYFTLGGLLYSSSGVTYNLFSSDTSTREANGKSIPTVSNVSVRPQLLAVPGPVAGAGLIPLVILAGMSWMGRRRARTARGGSRRPARI